MIKREDRSKITLAIGDGANDVSMILEAHIGVGIYGKEGMRAAQNSDFAIHEFKHLWNLVLFHGRCNYIRISEFIMYFFFKNFFFTIPHFYYAFFNNFSSFSIFEDWYVSFYNTFFTCVPIVVKAVFECDLNYKTSNKENVKQYYPYLYYVG